MRILISYAAAVWLLTAIATAADISGKWTGTLEAKGEDGQPISVPAHMEFKQSGSAITGAVWKDADHHYAIDNGRMDGYQITFEFTAPEGEEDSAFVHRVTLTRSADDRLEGNLEFEIEGGKVSGKLKLSRDK